MKRTGLLVMLAAANLGLAQAPPAPKKLLDQVQVLPLLASGVPSMRLAGILGGLAVVAKQAATWGRQIAASGLAWLPLVDSLWGLP